MAPSGGALFFLSSSSFFLAPILSGGCHQLSRIQKVLMMYYIQGGGEGRERGRSSVLITRPSLANVPSLKSIWEGAKCQELFSSSTRASLLKLMNSQCPCPMTLRFPPKRCDLLKIFIPLSPSQSALKLCMKGAWRPLPLFEGANVFGLYIIIVSPQLGGSNLFPRV